jgi:hypothetical protein
MGLAGLASAAIGNEAAVFRGTDMTEGLSIIRPWIGLIWIPAAQSWPSTQNSKASPALSADSGSAASTISCAPVWSPGHQNARPYDFPSSPLAACPCSRPSALSSGPSIAALFETVGTLREVFANVAAVNGDGDSRITESTEP